MENLRAIPDPQVAEEVEQLLRQWAENTRLGKKDLILADHDPEVVIFDVLAPLVYRGADEYRASWDEWQPETEGEMTFHFTELKVSAGADRAFAYGLIQCGGILEDGSPFEDLVRATFCLERQEDEWVIAHQHISKAIAE